MVQTLTMQASEAGPSSFNTSQDFIAFDDDDYIGHAEASEESGDEVPLRSKGEVAKRGADRSNSRKDMKNTEGKKRKLEDRFELEGKSKREKKRELARGTPWCVDVEFDRCMTPADILHDELMAFADWISPTRKEHETRKMVIHLIRKAIINQWPDAEVHAFGSQNTQLYMPQGDIDLVVVSRRMDDQRREGVLRSMAACLRRNNLATDVQVIARAKVPIIKFVCTYGKYKVDISVNQTNGIDASRFVQDWLQKCPALRPLIMATKLLLSQRGMSEVFSGGLGSYSVICLVISHLQMHPKVQRGEIDPSSNLGVLFLEFLELYGKNFGYDEVGISIVGKGKYFRKSARGWKDDRKPFMLSIEDPGDATNDISKGSFSILNVRQTLGGAYDIMTAVMCQWHQESAGGKRGKGGKRTYFDEDEEARDALLQSAKLGESDKDPDSLLGNIVGVNREMLKARKDIAQLWESGTLQYKLGRPPPPREPAPFAPPSRKTNDKSDPLPPRAPKAMRVESESSRGSVKVTTNGHTASTSRGTERKIRGSAVAPIVVIDDSSDSHLHSNRHNREQSKSTLLTESIESPATIEDSVNSDEDAEADTRYQNARNTKQNRSSRLDDFAKVAPRTFVIDDSASEEEEQGSHDDDSMEEGEIREADQVKKRKRTGADEDKRRKKREYWESKGNAVGGLLEGEESPLETEGLHVYQ